MQNYATMKCRLFSHMKDTKLAVLPVGMTSMKFWFIKCKLFFHETQVHFFVS